MDKTITHDLAAPGPASATPRTASTTRKWPAALAIVTAWLRPATTTQRTMHVSLLAAFAVHALGLITLAFVNMAENSFGPTGAPLSIDGCRQLIALGIENFFQDARLDSKAWLDLAWAAARLELITLLVVVIVTPFGAQNEPMYDSVAHGLRRTWLHTWHWVLIAFLALAAPLAFRATENVLYNHAHRVVNAKIPPMPQLRLRLAQRPLCPEWPIVRAHQQLRINYVSILPSYKAAEWLQTWDYFIRGMAELLAVFWVAWALLRGVSAPRAAISAPSSPRCVECGYDLRGLAQSTRCPECGLHLAQSIAPLEHSNPITESRRSRTGLLAFAWRSWRRPGELAAALSVPPRDNRYMRFLYVQMILPTALAVLIARHEGLHLRPWDPYGFQAHAERWIIVTPPAIIVAIASTSAWWASFRERRRSGRNLLRAGAQMASFLSVRLAAHASMLMFAIMLISVFHDWAAAFLRRLGARFAGAFELALITGFAIGLVATISYIIRVARSAPRVRYLYEQLR